MADLEEGTAPHPGDRSTGSLYQVRAVCVCVCDRLRAAHRLQLTNQWKIIDQIRVFITQRSWATTMAHRSHLHLTPIPSTIYSPPLYVQFCVWAYTRVTFHSSQWH